MCLCVYTDSLSFHSSSRRESLIENLFYEVDDEKMNNKRGLFKYYVFGFRAKVKVALGGLVGQGKEGEQVY